MTENTRIWDALSRTDPNHTKPFNRAGGFKGTAIKPIWIVKMLTEHFGPVGIGWGMGEPSFNVVEAGGEVMVYCTVKAWHTNPDNAFYGVGGDKVAAKRQSGVFCDDEAFKKAYTDAIGNAFKLAGVGADIHMGQFEDSKYLAELKEEFAEKDGKKLPKSKLQQAVRDLVAKINKAEDEDQIELLTGDADNAAVARQARQDLPDFWRSITDALEARRAHFEAQRQADSADVTHQPVEAEELPKDYFFLVDELEACATKEDLRKWALTTTERRAALPKGAQAKLRELSIEHQNTIKQSMMIAGTSRNGAGFTDLTAAG